MKNNYIKYIYTLVAFVTVLVSNAQVVFHETFGTSTTRTTSQYVPQGGNDANLGFSTFTCSSFYKPATEKYTADNKPTCKPDDLGSYNQYVYNISDGYYAVVDPRNKTKSSSPSSLDQLRDWAVTDPAVLGNSGAVLIVNAGELKNQYYRRGVTLKRNTSYKVSFKVLSSSANLPNNNLQFRSKVEVQSLVSEDILATSHIITTTSHNAWELKEYVFKTPNDLNCDNSYAISLRNDNPINSGNDFYIDDIILEEIVDPNAPVILCDTSMSQTGPIIKANDDTFTFQRNKNYNILVNDLYIPNDATLPVVVSGTTPNATIEKVGVWPTGYSIDTSTGQLFISDSATHVPTLAYKITSTQDPTKTSTATIFLKAVDLSVSLAVTNPYVSTSGTSHTYTLKIKNTGAEAIILSSLNKVSITVPRAAGTLGTQGSGSFDNMTSTSGKIGDWSWTRNSNYDYTFTYPDSGTVTLAVDEEKGVTFSRSYSISSGDSGNGARSITATLNYYLDYFEGNNTSNATIRKADETITTSHDSSPNPLCYGNSLVLTHNNSSILTPTSKYIFEYSYDGGLTWMRTEEQSSNTYVLSSVTGNIKVRSVRINGTTDNYSREKSITVTDKNEFSYNIGNSFSIPVNGSIVLPNVSTSLSSNVKIYRSDSPTIIYQQGQTVTFPTEGFYTLIVEATTTTSPICTQYSEILVNVYDLTKCNEITEKVYATKESWMTVPLLGLIPIGGVANTEKAIDKDLSTHSTITVAVGALGMGTTWHNLNFEHSIPKGTPVTVKLGQEYSAVQLAGGITVYAIDQNNQTIGPMISVREGALLDLLVGDNVFEFTFIPKDNNGNLIDYYGVRVNIGALVAVASNAKVFEAYYDKINIIDQSNSNFNSSKIVKGAARPGSSTAYPYPHADVVLNPLVDDVLWGVEDVGLGVATALSSVVYPYLAADTDLNTFAIFNKSVAALNRQKLTIKFNQIARPGDQIRILMGGFEVPVLDLSLLTDFKVQRYLGNVKVGPEVNGSQFKLLDLNLLSLLGDTGNRKALIVDAIDQPFDRVVISYLSTVQVGLLGDYTYIYDVTLMPKLYFDGQDPNDPYGSLKPITLCAQDYLKIEKPDPCTSYEIGFAYANKDTSGNIISFTDISGTDILKLVKETNSILEYEFKTLLPEYRNNLYIKLRVSRQGSQFGDYQYMRINLTNCDQGIVNPIIKSGANY